MNTVNLPQHCSGQRFKGYRCESDMHLYKWKAQLETTLTVPLNVENISPGCLPARNAVAQNMAGQSLFAVGWGKTQNGALISPTLNELRNIFI